jgi:hypothetical protein
LHKTVFLFEKANWVGIHNDLVSTDWLAVFNSCISIEDYWCVFLSIVTYCMNVFIPQKKFNINAVKRTNKKYPKHIHRLLNRKHRLWKKYSLFKSMRNKLQYKYVSRQCTRAINSFHAAAERRLIDSANVSSFYRYVNSKISCKSDVPPLITPSGELCSVDAGKAELFNNYFSSVYTIDNDVLPSALPNTDVAHPFTGVICTPTTVQKAITKMKNSKSCGSDNISVAFLKKLSFSISLPLCYVFNISLSTSCLPSQWKSAIVTPVFKKGKLNDPSNYRPISITSNICKLLESIIKDHIMHYLTINKLLSVNQYGFLPKRSTVCQLLDCCNDWFCCFDNKTNSLSSQVDVIYLDYAKAFDSVIYCKLLYKLKCIGVTGLILNWIENFLTDRTQCVRVGSSYSACSNVLSGVPQGSVLGPLLFLVYINDVSLINSTSNTKLFADDLKLYIFATGTDSNSVMQSYLNNISDWSSLWQLTLSASKCSVLSIGKNIVEYSYNINGVLLNRVTTMVDLGVTVDSKLTFDDHISHICTTARQRSALILKSFCSRDPFLLFKAFTTYVRPLLEYASCVWNPYTISHITQIESVQKNFTKRLCGLTSLTYMDRLAFLKASSLELRRLQCDLIMYFKIINGFVDIDSGKYFLFSHNTQTRGHKFKLIKQSSHTNKVENQFKLRAINVWNSLPSTIVNAQSVSYFKHVLHNHDLNQFLHV